MNVIQPKKPKGKAWTFLGPINLDNRYDSFAWEHDSGITVISAVEVAYDENDIEKGPEYHISISKGRNVRCDRNESKFVLKEFDMLDADEDNHVPNGFVRNYWKPVNENLIGHICPCKDTEPAIKENKGDFVWRGLTK